MTVNELLPLLRCVQCFASVALDAGSIVCPQCGTKWRTINGIFDLRPTTSIPVPRMYDDPHYQRWNEQKAQSHEYLYRANPIVAWVQNAGHRAVRALAASAPEALTLDMACGDGGHRPYMWRPDRVVGIDIDQPSLEQYRTRHPDASIVRGDCYRMPFGDGVFDRVINVYNLEHLVHVDFALEEARRVLKDDGELLAAVPTEGGAAWVLGRRLSTARRYNRDGFDYIRANAIDHCNCVWQIDKTLRRHFRVVRRRLFPCGLPSYHLNLVATWALRK